MKSVSSVGVSLLLLVTFSVSPAVAVKEGEKCKKLTDIAISDNGNYLYCDISNKKVNGVVIKKANGKPKKVKKYVKNKFCYDTVKDYIDSLEQYRAARDQFRVIRDNPAASSDLSIINAITTLSGTLSDMRKIVKNVKSSTKQLC